MANLRAGQTFKKRMEEYPMGSLAVLLPKDILDEKVLDTFTSIDGACVPSLGTHLLKRGEILIANKGSKFTTLLYNKNPAEAIATTAFYVITPGHDLLPEYLNWYLNQPEAKEYFLSSITGSVIPSINKTILNELPVPWVPVSEQAYICEFVKKTQEEQKLLKNLIAKREAFSRSFIWERIQKLS